ncbi:MAG: alpha/beta hydrolase [Candidatus Saccharibacteria bacterium]|nr:alpha/beta hydrolase [Candidatus Saccharibacteria bacterium]
MRQLIKDLFYWILDYVYVVKEEVASVLSRNTPEQYKTPGSKPIILIPGVYESWRFVRPIANLLHLHGYDVHVVDRLGYNRGTVEEMAEMVKDYITKHHLQKVMIVSHSKGGLIGKYLLTAIKQRGIVDGLIALNAPFSGSWYAYVLPFRSLRIFIPNSKILTLLAIDQISNSRIVSIYGKFDPHIPGGSRLEGAKNIQLNTYGHFRIINDPVVHRAILKSIALLS